MPEERWKFIEGYEKYLISDQGRVQNHDTGRILSVGANNYGDLRIAIRDGYGMEATRSVRFMVASAFVDRPSNLFDTPINLNGDKQDCRATNLAWRPNWFAWKFARQWREGYPASYINTPIRNTVTGSVYTNTLQCVANEGVLAADIWRSIQEDRKVFPNGDFYEVILL